VGFFDKIKFAAGGHGVSVFITEIEGTDPQSARFPLSESQLKATIEIHASKDVKIVQHTLELTVSFEDDGQERTRKLAQEIHPVEYTTLAGEVVQDTFCLTEIDLANAMRKLGLSAEEAIASPLVRLRLKVRVDIEDNIDATTTQQILIAPGVTSSRVSTGPFLSVRKPSMNPEKS
jgi:hypothetical protein